MLIHLVVQYTSQPVSSSVLQQFSGSLWFYAYCISRGCGPGSFHALSNNVIKDVCEVKLESGYASFFLHSDQRIITYLVFIHALHRLAEQNESLTSSPFFITDFMSNGNPVLLPLQ